MDYYIKVSLDIVYFEYYESKNSSIEDVDFIVHITKPGNNRYTADIICIDYLNDKNSKGLLMEVHVNKAHTFVLIQIFPQVIQHTSE